MIDSFVSRVVSEVMKPQSDKMPIGKVSDTVSKEPIKAEPPLLEYEKLRGRPYTAEYLDLGFDRNNPALARSNEEVLKIEKYIIDEIANRKWMPTLSSYKDVMDSIKSAVDIEKNTDSKVALDRILIYVDAMNKKNKYEKKIKDVVNKLHEYIKGDDNGTETSKRIH